MKSGVNQWEKEGASRVSHVMGSKHEGQRMKET